MADDLGRVAEAAVELWICHPASLQNSIACGKLTVPMREVIGAVPEEMQGYLGADVRIGGRVKFYDTAKAYGYTVADSGEEYYFNANSFRGDAPSKGDRVELCGERGPGGPTAKRVLVAANA